MKLYAHQEKLVTDIRQSFKQGNKSVCAVLSCGGGKSVIAATIAKSATDKGNEVLFIVHRKELCQQITETFIKIGVNMNLCVVGMVQTIVNKLELVGKPSIIITDEFHHGSSSTYKKIYNYFHKALRIGFTATPIRLSDGGLEDVADSLVEGKPTKWLIENNFLSPYVYYSIPVADLAEVKVSRGEYDTKQLTEIMESNTVYGETVKNYKLKANNKKAIIYCVSVASAEATAEEFRRNGYTAESLNGNTKKIKRTQIMQDFKDNKILILTNCELFGEGLDVPDVECVVLLRKTKSLTLYIQQSMRSMRYKPNKIATIIDHVGNVFEHDLPDSPHQWSLKKKKRKDKNTVMVKECPSCFKCLPLQVKVCDFCGYIFKAEDETEEQKIIDLELKEITRTDVLKAKPYIYHKGIKQWEELEEFRKAKNYKFMWSIRTAIDLKIEIPEKYDNYLRRLTQ